jgi:N utilization substance protein B
MGVRRQAREAALQVIFRCDFLNDWNLDEVHDCLVHFGVGETIEPFAAKLCEGVINNFVQIDSKLTCASENWSLSRMSRVDRSILRLATYEIAFLEEVPINVAINEAIEVAKRFGSEESPVFVNGVLDKVASTYRGELNSKIEVISTTAAPETKEEEVFTSDISSGDSGEETTQ